MIEIVDVETLDGSKRSIQIESETSQRIDANGLTLLPARIDPHVHFRVPGAEYKEDWRSAAKAAIAGGVSMVFDMPNNTPNCTSVSALQSKRAIIDRQLAEVGIPLQYGLYLGAEHGHLHEIDAAPDHAVGIKVFMGSSTGTLLVDDDVSLDEVFTRAAKQGLVVSVHAEDEAMVQARSRQLASETQPDVHSRIRNPEAAAVAVTKAIALAERHGTKLCVLHVSSAQELKLLRSAKARGVDVFVEATPHHLFLDTSAYAKWGNHVKVNPPLRDATDRKALWEAIADGTVDMIGSDHAPHTQEEKKQPYTSAPAGIAGVELTLPLLLDACHQGQLSLKRLVQLTHDNIESIFALPASDDWVLVDRNLVRTVKDEDLETKCGWSPYAGMTLTGWPVAMILQGKYIEIGAKECLITH